MEIWATFEEEVDDTFLISQFSCFNFKLKE